MFLEVFSRPGLQGPGNFICSTVCGDAGGTVSPAQGHTCRLSAEDHGPRSTQRGLASPPPPCPAPVFSKSQQTHPSVCSSARPLPCGLALTEPLGAAWAACPGCPPTSAPGVPHARGQPRGEAGDYTLPGPHLDGDSQHRALVTPPLVQSLPEDSLPGSRAESAQGPDTWGNREPCTLNGESGQGRVWGPAACDGAGRGRVSPPARQPLLCPPDSRPSRLHAAGDRMRVPEPRALLRPGNLSRLSLGAPARLPLGWSTRTFSGGFLL